MTPAVRPLGEVIHYIRGITFKPEDKVDPAAVGAVVCMRTKNIQDVLDQSDLIAVPEAFVRRQELYLREGDILISSANSWNLVGKCCQVPSLPYRATAGGFISVIRAKDFVDPRFLFHWLTAPRVQELVRNCARQTTNIANLSVDQFEALRIPVPSASEQRRIADILDKADAIRRKRREAIALTEELLRSTFLEMFGDPVTNPRGFEVRTLGELAEVNRGKFSPRPRNDPRFYGGAFPFIQTGELRNATGYLRTWKQTLNEEGCAVSRGFDRGTVAISIAANIGDAAIVDFDFYCPDSVVGIVPRPLLAASEYLEMMLRFFQPKLIAEAPETAQKNINLETLRPLRVPAPSRAAQETFGRHYRKVYALSARMEDATLGAEALFASLVASAFSGGLGTLARLPTRSRAPVAGAR